MEEFGSSEAGKKGGKARAKKLTPEQKSEIARRAAAARWAKVTGRAAGDDTPRAICGGDTPMRIGDVEIPCYVLDDERRVITLSGVFQGIGMSIGGGLTRLVAFANQIADSAAMASDLSIRLESPIEFIPPKGGVAKGYEATLLADLCDAILEARKNGNLTERYREIGMAAETLVRGFAIVGIIALVDEATGFEKFRKRFQLAEILDRYLSDKLNPWTKTFSDEFYEHLFRLLGWDYTKLKAGDRKPAEIGKITRDVVYRRLHPGIVQELETANPYVVPGRRLHKHHQWLTMEIGHPALKEHLGKVETVMKLSDNWLDFQNKLQRALPMQWDTGYFDWVSDEQDDPA